MPECSIPLCYADVVVPALSFLNCKCEMMSRGRAFVGCLQLRGGFHAGMTTPQPFPADRRWRSHDLYLGFYRLREIENSRD